MTNHFLDPTFCELRDECYDLLRDIALVQASSPTGSAALCPPLATSLQEIIDGQPLTPERVMNLTAAVRILALYDRARVNPAQPVFVNREARRAAQYGGRR